MARFVEPVLCTCSSLLARETFSRSSPYSHDQQVLFFPPGTHDLQMLCPLVWRKHRTALLDTCVVAPLRRHVLVHHARGILVVTLCSCYSLAAGYGHERQQCLNLLLHGVFDLPRARFAAPVRCARLCDKSATLWLMQAAGHRREGRATTSYRAGGEKQQDEQTEDSESVEKNHASREGIGGHRNWYVGRCKQVEAGGGGARFAAWG